VSECEPIRPSQAGMLPLVVTGSAMGVSHAPLVEVRQGKGVWLVCQLKVVSKFDTEPMARILLQRMLNYLTSYQPPQSEILCFGPQDLREHLERLRVDWKPLEDWDELRDPTGKVLFLKSGGEIAAHISLLRSFLQGGGVVVWHRPNFGEFEKVRVALNLPLVMQPYKGAATRIEGQGELLNFLFREDLYWLGPVSGPEWEPTPLAMDMAEAIFSPEVKMEEAMKFEAEEGVETEKQGVTVLETEVSFWANSRAHWQVNFPATGKYYFAMMARGTPVEGVYPTAEIYLDGEKVGVMSISSEKPQLFSCSIFAKAGMRRLTIAFVNDAYRPPEDRNLWVDYFLIVPVKKEVEAEALTSPPALVVVPLGKGKLILCSIRWDEAGRNGRKAQRFISSLLTALGAKFRYHANISVIEAEQMTPQPNLQWFRRETDHIYMGTNGYVEMTVKIVKSGRYRIGIWAKGTAMKGIYPIVSLELGDKTLGQVECKSDDWSVHFITAELPQGTYPLRLRFINDSYDPRLGEDRNLWVDKIEFEPLSR
ncbi:MAG: carbohydrate-binding domain-containing protein, partial [Armatimonadota bacterium]